MDEAQLEALEFEHFQLVDRHGGLPRFDPDRTRCLDLEDMIAAGKVEIAAKAPPTDTQRAVCIMLVQITAPHFSAGITLKDDVVVAAAPVLKWTLGKTRDELCAYFKRKGWTVRVVPE